MTRWTGTGIVFLIAGGCSFLWAQDHGVFSSEKLRVPVNLHDSSTFKIPFSVTQPGIHDIQLQYSNESSDHLVHDLKSLTGSAILRIGGAQSQEVTLPTRYLRGGNGTLATVILWFWPSNKRDYELTLNIFHLPSDLDGKLGAVIIGLDPRDNKQLAGMLLLSILMTIAGIVRCAV